MAAVEKNWVVAGIQFSQSPVKHKSLESAEVEAQKLAAENNQMFYVYEKVSAFARQIQPVTRLDIV